MAIDVVKIREFTGHTQAIYSMCLNEKGNGFFSAGADGFLVEWHMHETDGNLRAKLDSACYALCFYNGHLLAGSHKGNLSVFDSEYQLHKFLKISDFPIFDILHCEDLILIASGDGHLHVFNLAFEAIVKIKISEKSIRQVVPYLSGFALASSDGNIYFMNSKLEIFKVLKAHEGTVFSLAYHSKLNKMISGGKDACINLYDTLLNKETIAAHLLHVHSLAINQESAYMLSGSMDKEIKLWDLKENKLLKVVNLSKHKAHRSSVNKILWFDKNNFISCSDDRTLMCFEIQDQK